MNAFHCPPPQKNLFFLSRCQRVVLVICNDCKRKKLSVWLMSEICQFKAFHAHFRYVRRMIDLLGAADLTDGGSLNFSKGKKKKKLKRPVRKCELCYYIAYLQLCAALYTFFSVCFVV